jgi:hypothetical protein
MGAFPQSTITSPQNPFPAPQAGTIFVSGKASAYGGGAILGGRAPPGNATFDFTLLTLILENLTFRVCYADPALSAVNLGTVGSVQLHHVNADAGVYGVPTLPRPTNTKATAFILPYNNGGNDVLVSHANAIGYFCGYDLSEHLVGGHLIAAGCLIGCRVRGGNHANIIQRLQTVHCPYGVSFLGARSEGDPNIGALDITQYDIEDVVTPTKPIWQRDIYKCDDRKNYGRGLWRYRRVVAYVGPNGTFTKNGGKGVTATDIGE